MAFAQGIDFRATSTGPSGFSGDPAKCDKEISTAANYPRTPASGDATAVGWEQAVNLSRDRSGTVDPRLAGVHEGQSNQKYRIDLPAPGAYTITAAFGDAAFGSNGASALATQILDATTVLATCVPAGTPIGAGHFYDASGADNTAAAWPTGNTPVTLTFTTTILRVQLGGVSGTNSPISHIFVQAASGGTTNLKSLSASFAAGASLGRAIDKTVTASFSAAAALLRSLTRTLTGSFTAAGAIVTHKAGQLLTLTASFAAHAVVVRHIKKNLSARRAVSAALVRRINKKLTASRVVTATVSRRVARKLTAAATWAATQTNNAGVITKLLTASFTAGASLARKIGLTLRAPVTFKVLLTRLINTHWIKTAASSATWAAQSAGSAVWTKISGDATAWTKQ